jgi:hypothetical protein
MLPATLELRAGRAGVVIFRASAGRRAGLGVWQRRRSCRSCWANHGRLSSTAADRGAFKAPLVGTEIELLLTKAGVAREPLVDHAGLLFIRRAFEGGRHYFIANRGEQPLNGWVTLATKAASVVIMDAMTGQAGIGAMRLNTDGTAQVYLQLQAGESAILRMFAGRKIQEPAWVYWQAIGQRGTHGRVAGEVFADLPCRHRSRRRSWRRGRCWAGEARRFADGALQSRFDAPAAPLKVGGWTWAGFARARASDLMVATLGQLSFRRSASAWTG